MCTNRPLCWLMSACCRTVLGQESAWWCCRVTTVRWQQCALINSCLESLNWTSRLTVDPSLVVGRPLHVHDLGAHSAYHTGISDGSETRFEEGKWDGKDRLTSCRDRPVRRLGLGLGERQCPRQRL